MRTIALHLLNIGFPLHPDHARGCELAGLGFRGGISSAGAAVHRMSPWTATSLTGTSKETARFPKLPALAERLRDVKRPPVKIAGAYECESLAIVNRTPGTTTETQDLRAIGNGWSGDAHLLENP